MSLIAFWILAFISVGAAILMVVNRNPVRSALFLVTTFLAVAAFYVTLSAQFLAAVQIIVYAGAIMVLFLFVIMLLNMSAPEALKERGSLQPPIAVALGIGFVVALTLSQALISIPPSINFGGNHDVGTVRDVGLALYDKAQPWLFPFEITSILLLIAVVGAIVMAKRRI